MEVESVGILLLFFKFGVGIFGFIFGILGLVMRRVDRLMTKLEKIKVEHDFGYRECMKRREVE